jgi:RNA polymerase subunit RPABC4/transcription elongation factor Spt4
MAVASGKPPTGMLMCSACQREFPATTVFCPYDGTKVEAPKPGQVQGLICPTCRRGFPGDAKFCPNDSDELVPYAMYAARHKARESGLGEKTKICPSCGDRYDLTVTFCGKDGAELVLVN